jgi:glycine cleavage system H protein
VSYPQNCRYSKDHEWIRVEGDRGTVGITHHAQEQLGDVVFLELPEVGRTLKAGEVFGTVESVKAVSELFSPVSGEVVDAHGDLTKSPEKVNTDPHGEAWMIVVKLGDPKELDGLMDAAQYEAYAASETK